MGWTGTFVHYWKGDTNKDLLMRAYPSIARGVEEGRYKLSQKGSHVYMLYQCDIPENKSYGKWFVCKYLCSRNKGEFLTKDIDAISNHCFDFPKDWLKYLDATNPDIAEYLEKRKLHEQTSTKASDFKIGDYVKCVAPYELNWSSGYKISKGEMFYIHIRRHSIYTKRATKEYVITKPRFSMADWEHKPANEWYMNDNIYRISTSVFNSSKGQKLSADDLQEIFKVENEKRTKELESLKEKFSA